MIYILTWIYISFYFIRPTEWVPGLIDIQLFFVLGLVCLAALVINFLSGTFRLEGNASAKMMFGYVFAILYSHISRFYVSGTIAAFNIFFPVAVGFFLILYSIDTRKRLNSFILLLVILSTFLACEGWLQHTRGFAHGGLEPLRQGMVNEEGEVFFLERICWYGVFNDPNDFGLALVLVLPFLLNMLLTGRFILPLICLPIIAPAIYFTNSRGSLLAALAAIMSFFVIRYRSMKGVIVGLILASILMTFGPSRMGEISGSESSAYGRIEAWYAGFQMFKDHPLFGVGQGLFTEDYPLTAHNSYVLVMGELGLLGMFFFTGLMYFPLQWVWQEVFLDKSGCRLSEEDLGVLSAVSASLISIMTAMFFLSRSYILVPFILMALLAACTRVFSPSDSLKILTEKPNRWHFRNIVIVMLFQLIFINIMVKVFI